MQHHGRHHPVYAEVDVRADGRATRQPRPELALHRPCLAARGRAAGPRHNNQPRRVLPCGGRGELGLAARLLAERPHTAAAHRGRTLQQRERRPGHLPPAWAQQVRRMPAGCKQRWRSGGRVTRSSSPPRKSGWRRLSLKGRATGCLADRRSRGLQRRRAAIGACERGGCRGSTRLGRSRSRCEVGELLQLLGGGARPEARAVAASVLGTLGSLGEAGRAGAAAVPARQDLVRVALARAALADPDKHVRRNAVHAIGRCPAGRGGRARGGSSIGNGGQRAGRCPDR